MQKRDARIRVLFWYTSEMISQNEPYFWWNIIKVSGVDNENLLMSLFGYMQAYKDVERVVDCDG